MKKKYQVSDVAEVLGTEVYTLRCWENQLGLEVPRNAAGHRYYEEEQIRMFRHVKRLTAAGFGLRQIKAMGERMAAVAALPDEKLQELRNRIITLDAEQEENFCRRKAEEPEEQEDKVLPLCIGERKKYSASVQEEHVDNVRLLQESMTKWMGELLQKNNEHLTNQIEESISERMARELRFLFRQQEEREEERYRRLDRTIREHQQARLNGKQQVGAKDSFLLARKLHPLR